MEIEDVYITGIHGYTFRAGEPAKIIGIKMVRPKEKRQRLCYEVQFVDGVFDLIAVSEVEAGLYDICTLQEL